MGPTHHTRTDCHFTCPVPQQRAQSPSLIGTVIAHPSLEGTKDMNKALSPSFLLANHCSDSFLVICCRPQASDQVSKTVCPLRGTEQAFCRHFYSQKSVMWLSATKVVGLDCKSNFFQPHIPIHTNTRVSASVDRAAKVQYQHLCISKRAMSNKMSK